MYLRALNGVKLAALHDANDALWGPGDYGPSPSDCRAQGGTPILRQRGYMSGSYWTPNIWSCQMPAPAPAYVPSAPAAPVYVTSTVQTAVSPQISPVFVQQDQPSNSPVGAATQQTSPATQSASSGQSSEFKDYLDYIKAQDADRNAREQTLYDLLAKSVSGPANDSASSPVPVSYSQAPPELDPELQTGQVAGPSKLEQYTPLIAFASALIGLGIVLRKNRASKRG